MQKTSGDSVKRKKEQHHKTVLELEKSRRKLAKLEREIKYLTFMLEVKTPDDPLYEDEREILIIKSDLYRKKRKEHRLLTKKFRERVKVDEP